MKKFNFLAYLAPEGLTLEEAKNVVEILGSMIDRLADETSIDSLVEKTEVSWLSGADGNMHLKAELKETRMSPADFKALPQNLEQLSKAKALKSWLEICIKYMEDMIAPCTVEFKSTNRVRNIYDVYNYTDANQHMRALLLPLIPPLPEDHDIERFDYSAADYYASLSADRLAAYYSAQAAASTIGDFIHPSGRYAQARNTLVDVMANPCQIENSLKATTIIRRVPAFDIDKVDGMYFALQAQQRDFQKEVNSVKYKAEDAVTEAEHKYYEECQKLQEENARIWDEYTDTINSLIKDINKAASEMRIAVPKKAQEFLKEILSR